MFVHVADQNTPLREVPVVVTTIKFLATMSAAIFTGAALYINVVEYPARGALLIGSVVPFTFIGIMPTNHKLLAQGRDLSSDETRTLLESWARLHAVRTALGIAATVLYLWRALAG